jgi:D-xylose transport system substrate-binding protein
MAGRPAGARKLLLLVLVCCWINGSPTDNNATLFKQGAHAGLDGKVRVAAESDTTKWNPDNARAWAANVLPTLRGRTIVGVYAANDGTAGAAIAAMKAAGLPPVPVTGQDAETAALEIVDADRAGGPAPHSSGFR